MHTHDHAFTLQTENLISVRVDQLHQKSCEAFPGKFPRPPSAWAWWTWVWAESPWRWKPTVRWGTEILRVIKKVIKTYRIIWLIWFSIASWIHIMVGKLQNCHVDPKKDPAMAPEWKPGGTERLKCPGALGAHSTCGVATGDASAQGQGDPISPAANGTLNPTATATTATETEATGTTAKNQQPTPFWPLFFPQVCSFFGCQHPWVEHLR